jgi:hypothetical protein
MVDLIREVFALVRERRKYWLLPVFAILLILGSLLVVAESTVIGPLIYAIF